MVDSRMPHRVSVTRIDRTCLAVEGTATWDGRGLSDFRFLDGSPMPLPRGSRFEIHVYEHAMRRPSKAEMERQFGAT